MAEPAGGVRAARTVGTDFVVRDARAPLTLEPGRSPRLAVALTLVHGAAVAGLAYSGLRPAAAGLLGLVVAASLWHSLRTHALRTAPGAVRTLTFGSDGRVVLTRRSGATEAYDRVQGSLPLPSLAIVRVGGGAGWGGRAIVIPGDAVAAATHRRLRVLLRWGLGNRGAGTSGRDR